MATESMKTESATTESVKAESVTEESKAVEQTVTTESADEQNLFSEYVDKVKNYYGNVSYYCNLCNLQFSEKLMHLHCKGKAHENFLKVAKERDVEVDKLINAKYDELLPDKEKFDTMAKLVLDCEESLKLVSDELHGSDGREKTNGSSDKKEEDGEKKEGEGEEAMEEEVAEVRYRSLVGVVRVGYMGKGLLMNQDNLAHLVVLCSHKPTIQLLKQVSQLLSAKFELINPNSYAVEVLPNEASIMVRGKKSTAMCQISVTSASMGPHPFQYYNAQMPADPEGMLPSDKCNAALREMRRARWFEAKLYSQPLSGTILRIMRDQCSKDPHWSAIDFWVVENLVEKCLSLSEAQLSPSLALLSFMQLIASGVLIGDTPGLYDPCERLPTDLLANIDSQLLEHLTRKAQEAVRLISFGDVEKVLSGNYGRENGFKAQTSSLKRAGQQNVYSTGADANKKKR